MKRSLTAAGVLLLLLYLLMFPKEALQSAREGMGLWLNTLLPTLLPFLILTGILLRTNMIEKILQPFASFWKQCFGLSPCGAYVFLIGMLCGYPMGAKLTSDLYQSKKLSRREAHYLLTFTNNPSPAFLTTYLAQHCLGGKSSPWNILGILLLSDFLCMLFFRFVVYKSRTATPARKTKKETLSASSPGTAIDVSIMNGFETISRLGGYILLFSLLSAWIHHYWPFPSCGEYIILGIMEITTGLNQITALSLPYSTQYLYSMVLTAFGGLCIMAQTKSVLEGKLSLLPYTAAKCLNALFTFILVSVFTKLV